MEYFVCWTIPIEEGHQQLQNIMIECMVVMLDPTLLRQVAEGPFGLLQQLLSSSYLTRNSWLDGRYLIDFLQQFGVNI